MAEGTIADLTGNIPISLWEDNLALITTAAVYRITNIRVHFWNGAKKLTTSPNSVISAIQDEKLKSITMEEHSEVPQEDESGTLKKKKEEELLFILRLLSCFSDRI